AAPVAPGTTTELVVQARGTQRPLEDLEVSALANGDKRPRLIGRTDARGAVTIEAGGRIEIVSVRSGDDLLARFPLVPGFESSLVAHVDDNGRRLESGDLVDRLGEELIDLVAQQTLLRVRFKREASRG